MPSLISAVSAHVERRWEYYLRGNPASSIIYSCRQTSLLVNKKNTGGTLVQFLTIAASIAQPETAVSTDNSSRYQKLFRSLNSKYSLYCELCVGRTRQVRYQELYAQQATRDD